ncbi:sigma-70 family RNA polymerase sigma factor [Rossellomorea sp. AcN35-11]|nr:sigma-70 family RNA polymerase sigma factor [Rossellomorea aquimaris]WJV29835.1 sigma-70 family RNA polymerase sigma factor [Rossellomorea sp. AcN35-11]
MNVSQESAGHRSHKEILIELMEEYGDMVLRIAYTYVKEKQLAEDVSQEVFIKCYQSLHRFEQRSSYRTWLYSITVNTCKDYVKSWSFRNLIPSEATEIERGHGTDSVSAHVISKEDKAILFREVLKLPVKYREAIIFFYYEDLTIEEMAHVLDVKVNTVKTRLHRGRNRLMKRMKGGVLIEE